MTDIIEKKEKKKGNNKEIEGLKYQINELEDRLLRNQAELQNFKRRKEEERDQFIKFCNEDMIKEILPILDNFERAIGMDDDNPDDEVSRFLEGFIMVYNSLVDTLKQFGAEEIKALGGKFDPNLHQALLTGTDTNQEDDIVLEVLQKGYILKDRIIRPVMVKVNINKEKEIDKNE